MSDVTESPDGRWVESKPTHCPAGHPLVGGRVLIGWDPMTAERTWLCRACGLELRQARDGTKRVVQQAPIPW